VEITASGQTCHFVRPGESESADDARGRQTILILILVIIMVGPVRLEITLSDEAL